MVMQLFQKYFKINKRKHILQNYVLMLSQKFIISKEVNKIPKEQPKIINSSDRG